VDREREMVSWTIVIFGLAAIHEGILGPAVACFGPDYDISMLVNTQVIGMLLTMRSSWGCCRAPDELQCSLSWDNRVDRK
jgi:hypothetical protein